MTYSKLRNLSFRKIIIPAFSATTVLLTFSASTIASENHSMTQFDTMPVSIATESIAPRVMINTSNDHQLYFKAFNDYTDLDAHDTVNGDALPETTYKHSVDYYGYFDSKKCYKYTTDTDLKTTDKGLFVPATLSADKYCTAADEWSGNFLNWVSMARIDVIRKVLFGGHRRIDTSTKTILERTYLPNDAHSWAKHYSGSDLSKLTPFTSGTDYYCDDTILPKFEECSGVYSETNGGTPIDDPILKEAFKVSATCQYTDVAAMVASDEFKKCYTSKEIETDDGNKTFYTLDKKKLGITFGNTTEVADKTGYSETYPDPPLIKAVKGNYSLWASSQRYQVMWSDDIEDDPWETWDDTYGENENNPDLTNIHAYNDSPKKTDRVVTGKDYIVRVQACVEKNTTDANGNQVIDTTYFGNENCKKYPDRNYKPIGLLQAYGDNDEMYFGMIAGTYKKHLSGGSLLRNVQSLKDEINVTTDGTFKLVHHSAGGVVLDTGSLKPGGLINAWSLFRIVGYKAGTGTGDVDGTYKDGDNCPWGLSSIATNTCSNWGNPFSEIYYQSINYFAGGKTIGDYNAQDSNLIEGLPRHQKFVDPLPKESYCADLYTINLNSSAPSYDYDDLDGQSFGPLKIWGSQLDSLNNLSGSLSSAMTDVVGGFEGINNTNNKTFYVGETSVDNPPTSPGDDFQLCTSKEVTSLGQVGGICPESPRLGGSYRIAGLAYYAHMYDIRPSDVSVRLEQRLKGKQTVDSYSVSMSSGAPTIEIPDPKDINAPPALTILPACRNTDLDGNCALVDFKIVAQKQSKSEATGTLYINWEDSEQGGDYDQDMWGTLSYKIDFTKTTNNVTITTNVHAKSTDYPMGFGYVIGGVGDTDSGFHAHSGINDYTRAETVDSNQPNCETGCWPDHKNSSKTYTLSPNTSEILKDPLWYAAKYGGFIDHDGNKMPDKEGLEWDTINNKTGKYVEGGDGDPDNYFYAANPQELEDSLKKTFDAILNRSSSGTAAAVVSNNVRGEGALYQAYFEPRKKKGQEQASWIGTLQALWLDSYGLSRQDCSPSDFANSKSVDDNGTCLTPTSCTPNSTLDNYCVDQVVETYYDEGQSKTLVRVYQSSLPNEFSAFSMQGVVVDNAVTGEPAGTIKMSPNSMEGTATVSGSTIKISPYQMTGKVTAYSPSTGEVTIDVAVGDVIGSIGSEYKIWNVFKAGPAGQGLSGSSITLQPGSATFTIVPAGDWIEKDDVLTIKTKNLFGASGKSLAGWDVTCLEGAIADGTILASSLFMDNTSPIDTTFSPDTSSSSTADFSTCIRAKVTSYNLKGAAGAKYDDWLVSNQTNGLGKGTSSTEITLGNRENRTFAITPDSKWLESGDNVRIANYSTQAKAIDDIGYIWNAREELNLPTITDANLKVNRKYGDKASTGRFITTWIDDNLNSLVDKDEYRPFQSSILSANAIPSYTHFDVDDLVTAQSVIDYVRGVELPGTRSRTITYSDKDTVPKVMRLGDIVNSTPTTVAAPAEAFDLLYFDDTYRSFRQLYANRRIVVYAGANDGLLHAFNGGFYNVTNSKIGYSVAGKNPVTGAAATEHPLGSELWAYAPKNLLSHLQWLKDPAYENHHVSFIDAKPRIFDAKIFPFSTNHPYGWGTVMVVGMNLGGGAMEVNVDKDANGTKDSKVVTRSAYLVFDITNPELEPTLLGEFTLPVGDDSFTTVYPTVAAFQDANQKQPCLTGCNNEWYLIFGNGPDNPLQKNSTPYNITQAESSQTAKVYAFDLKQLTSKNNKSSIADSITLTGGQADPTCIVAGSTTCPDILCSVSEDPNSKFRILKCDTFAVNSFMGTPTTVDNNLDFKANTSYFGIVRSTETESFWDANDTDPNDKATGKIYRFSFLDEPDISKWKAPAILLDTGKPISFSAQITPSSDETGQTWIYAGTGRLHSAADKLNEEPQYLYGIKDYYDPADSQFDDYSTPVASILDVTKVEVYSDGTLEPPAPGDGPFNGISGTELLTFDDIVDDIDNHAAGWQLQFPPIVGYSDAPSTRNTTRSALIGGALFTSVFQPGADPCASEGQSRLYGLYYKTGTGFPGASSIFGTTIVTKGGKVKYQMNKFIDLGRGMATAPAIHSGSGSGDNSLKVFTQLSTGEMKQSEANSVLTIRSGRTSWTDQ